MRVDRGYEHDTIQHPGITLPTAYYNPSAAFSERLGRLIERVTQSTNLLRRIGTGITLGASAYWSVNSIDCHAYGSPVLSSCLGGG
jgi:hypothetical protein